MTLTAGQTYLLADWGYKPACAISGALWDDGTGNGTKEAGEPGVSGIQVALYDAAGTTPILDSNGNPYVVTTDGNRFYQFTNLPAGVSYTVKVVTKTLPSGATNDKDPDSAYPNGSDQAVVAVPAGGGTVANQDFGYILPDLLLKSVSPTGAGNPARP